MCTSNSTQIKESCESQAAKQATPYLVAHELRAAAKEILATRTDHRGISGPIRTHSEVGFFPPKKRNLEAAALGQADKRLHSISPVSLQGSAPFPQTSSCTLAGWHTCAVAVHVRGSAPSRGEVCVLFSV